MSPDGCNASAVAAPACRPKATAVDPVDEFSNTWICPEAFAMIGCEFHQSATVIDLVDTFRTCITFFSSMEYIAASPSAPPTIAVVPLELSASACEPGFIGSVVCNGPKDSISSAVTQPSGVGRFLRVLERL